jgi:hypothetical protein
MTASELSVSLKCYIFIAKPQTCIGLLAVMQNGYFEICALLGLYEE